MDNSKTPETRTGNTQICCECGRSVAMGSGRFVNRVPVGDDFDERELAGRPYPRGEWICAKCDEADA